MPAVLKTLISEFMVPYMNLHHFTGSYLEHNRASRRVFEKCGFVFVAFQEAWVEMPEVKMGVVGKKLGLGLLRWDRVEEV